MYDYTDYIVFGFLIKCYERLHFQEKYIIPSEPSTAHRFIFYLKLIEFPIHYLAHVSVKRL